GRGGAYQPAAAGDEPCDPRPGLHDRDDRVQDQGSDDARPGCGAGGKAGPAAAVQTINDGAGQTMSVTRKLASKSVLIFGLRIFGAGFVFIVQAAISRVWGAQSLGDFLLVIAAA